MTQNAENIYAAPQAAYEEKADGNTSGMGKMYPVPEEVKGWSWGAFFLNWIWAIGNQTWIGLLALVPYLGFIVAIILGVKGREWAWQNKRWDSVEHFNRVQRQWSTWGVCLLSIPILGIVAAVANPAFSRHTAPTVDFRTFMYTQRVASHVGAYIVRNHRLPATVADTGMTEPIPADVRSIELNQQTAQLEITLNQGLNAGKTFYMAPSTDKDGYIVWRCLHGGVQQNLLPRECRYSAADPFSIK